MLTFSQMLVRLVVSLILGGLMGLEREVLGKQAGVRTSMLVSAGAAIFTMIALELPFLVSSGGGNLPDVLAHNSGSLNVIANIVVGIGFLGAGIIIKTGEKVHGLTTAALVWTVAGIGILVGLGYLPFAIAAAVIIPGTIYIWRKSGIYGRFIPVSAAERESEENSS
ncbi:MAG: MgtC/SapB family protein [Candidatus Liptonbacteria bacterium]|nr:MgtC/SapB family protein [Candidatus Liptonbacteria bacterium]